jgi:hypothetical protein
MSDHKALSLLLCFVAFVGLAGQLAVALIEYRRMKKGD